MSSSCLLSPSYQSLRSFLCSSLWRRPSLTTSFTSCPTSRRPGPVHLLEEEDCSPSSAYMWNVHDRSSTGSTRTTNSLEAFNHSFNSLISCHCQHPSLWKLLSALKKWQNLTDSTILKIQRGDTYRTSAAKITRNARLSTILEN